MSLLAASWTAALATVGLFVGAVITAWYARKAFREQSREVALLHEQVANEQTDRALEAAERRQAQAAKVFIWVTEPEDDLEPVIHVRNTSGQPIYEVTIAWDNDAVATPVATSEGGPFMPGAHETFDFGDLPSARTVVWLDFRDASGRRWRTTSEGELRMLK